MQERGCAMLTQNELKEILDYNPETGEFIWKIRKQKIKHGSIAGTINAYGYRQIAINGRIYRAHRLAWLYVYGYLPTKLIDHKNRNRSDNKIANLREANKSENAQNTNARGYYFHKPSGKFLAQIRINGKQINLGLFVTEDEARATYESAKLKYHTFNPVPRELAYA